MFNKMTGDRTKSKGETKIDSLFMNASDTSLMDTVVRKATVEDCESIMKLIQELAEYEKLPKNVKISAEVLRKDGFGDEKYFHCFVAEKNKDGKKSVVGYALYYYIYSTWEGKAVYMEDLYVQPQYRGQGIGSRLWSAICQTAVEKNCQRLDFAVLSWNQPSIDYYKRQGAINLTTTQQWHLYRLKRDVLENLASKFTDIKDK